MKPLAPFIFFLFSLFYMDLSAQDWKYDFEEATIEAKEKKQNIVLLFTGSDWCPPCIRLERKIFSNDTFKKFAETNFVWVKADFPKRKKNKLPEAQQNKNDDLAERYNKKWVFPVLLVVDTEGKVLGATGYSRKMNAEDYMELLTSFNSFGE